MAHPTAAGDLGTTGNNHVAHPTLCEGTSHPIPKFQEMPLVTHHLWVLIHMGVSPQSQYQRSNSEILGNLGPNNRPSQSSRHTNYNFDYRKLQRQPHARFDKRYNWRYSPPIYPLTPSLNNSFSEALSRSLLQIAENQSRTIDAMQASQEAQATAYKEMTKTNKMRDDNTLFHSIEVYYGSNPTKFEKWIDKY